MRVESGHTCPSGGWYHFFGDKEKKYLAPKLPPRIKPTIDCVSLMHKWSLRTTETQVATFAKQIGVSIESLRSMSVAWSSEYSAWAFPMRNAAGNIIGIRLRNLRGFKWAVEGSLQGVFIPQCDKQKIAFLPEGPTDTCAALSLGLFAVGRPTCQSGNEMIKDTLRRLEIFQAVIVGDNDDLKKVGNSMKRPGIEGALKLKKELGLNCVVWSPPSPIKDLRELLNKGGTKELVLSEIKNKVWSKK